MGHFYFIAHGTYRHLKVIHRHGIGNPNLGAQNIAYQCNIYSSISKISVEKLRSFSFRIIKKTEGDNFCYHPPDGLYSIIKF